MDSASSRPEMSPHERELRMFMDSPEQSQWLLEQARSMVISAGISSGAEDLVQETYLKAFKNIQGFQGKCQMSTWLYRILLNTFRNFLRSHRGRKEIGVADDQFLDNFPYKPLHNEIISRELETLYELSVQALGENQKFAFLLCVLEQLSYTEAARRLGLNVTQLRGNLYRARQNIRNALVDYSGE